MFIGSSTLWGTIAYGCLKTPLDVDIANVNLMKNNEKFKLKYVF